MSCQGEGSGAELKYSWDLGWDSALDLEFLGLRGNLLAVSGVCARRWVVQVCVVGNVVGNVVDV